MIILDKLGDGRQNGTREAGSQEQGALGVIVRPARIFHPAICDLNFRPFPAFLPGSGKHVECDVTYTKQTTAPFLPGATTAHIASRMVQRDAQFGSRMFSPGAQCRALGARNSPFLTGSASQTELAVTHSKQTTGTFLTGARTLFRNSRSCVAIKENF